jgi:hypothetical protein
VFAAAIPAFSADAPAVNGKWGVHLSIAGTERDMTCTFTQKDKELTGSCETDSGAVRVNGTVEDRKVAWQYKSEYNGSPLTVSFSGTVDSPEKMTGRVVAEEFGVEGDFSATPSK